MQRPDWTADRYRYTVDVFVGNRHYGQMRMVERHMFTDLHPAIDLGAYIRDRAKQSVAERYGEDMARMRTKVTLLDDRIPGWPPAGPAVEDES